MGVGRTILNVTLVTDHMTLRINDLLLVLNCVFGPLIESNVVLCTSGGNLPLSGTIRCKSGDALCVAFV